MCVLAQNEVRFQGLLHLVSDEIDLTLHVGLGFFHPPKHQDVVSLPDSNATIILLIGLATDSL
tara:strand:- start:353 stop:541 length:189 start_codon:yes stop_codon:yes gene_type:complete